LVTAGLVVALGLYGALATAKYHERSVYHLMQARALTETLTQMGALYDDSRVEQFREQHYGAYPRLHRVRLNWLWTGLHLTVAGYGIGLGLLILFQ
jgi:hypothetical protein